MLYLDYLEKLKQQYPKFGIIHKSDNTFMKAINIFLLVVTFGQMKSFLTDFITTIGYIVYVPADWDVRLDVDKYIILRHEAVHMRQRTRDGSFLFSLKYLFWPMPVLFAKARLTYELEGYVEQLKVIRDELQIDIDYEKKFVVNVLSGSQYFWTWIIKKDIEKILQDKLK